MGVHVLYSHEQMHLDGHLNTPRAVPCTLHAVAYTRCIRAHGVWVRSLIGNNTPGFEAAKTEACTVAVCFHVRAQCLCKHNAQARVHHAEMQHLYV